MKSGIYKITNVENNKCYIGLSKDLDSRKKQHFNGGIDKTQKNKALYAVMQDRGVDSFSFEILEYCPPEDLAKREIFYIKKYNSYENGYNSTLGGEGASNSNVHNKYGLINGIRLIDDWKYQLYDNEYNLLVNNKLSNSINTFDSLFQKYLLLIEKQKNNLSFKIEELSFIKRIKLRKRIKSTYKKIKKTINKADQQIIVFNSLIDNEYKNLSDKRKDTINIKKGTNKTQYLLGLSYDKFKSETHQYVNRISDLYVTIDYVTISGYTQKNYVKTPNYITNKYNVMFHNIRDKLVFTGEKKFQIDLREKNNSNKLITVYSTGEVDVNHEFKNVERMYVHPNLVWLLIIKLRYELNY